MDQQITNNNPNNSSIPRRANPFIIPATILIGFALIAAAIYFNGKNNNQAQNTDSEKTQQTSENSSIRPIDENDHILGNPNAPIMIVEYSDFDCPFCKSFHHTMQQIIEDYGATGKVAWVYRQFPLEQLHPNAPTIALASECVAHIGGNDAFWKFADLIYQEREMNELTNMTKITDYVKEAGVDITAFNNCLKEGTYIDKINNDFHDALNAGAKGTPYSFILVGDQQEVINGALPYASVKSIIETLLQQMGEL